MAGRLRNKVAIITGAGRGIGEAVAKSFVAEGAAVVIAEMNEASARKVESDLRQENGSAISVVTDVRDADSVKEMVECTLEAFGRVDILVNNAGINVFRNPLEADQSSWQQCMQTNLEGAWLCAQAVLPHLLEGGGGSIVNMASCHSHRIIRGCFPYPVAKHALVGLTRSLAVEFAHANIRVNAIAPGYIETQLAVDYWNSFPDSAAERRRISDLHPPKRLGWPKEVAMTAVFLASDEAPFINGAVIPMDGGRSLVYHD
ncbi:MAG TPA: SDR family oxidoreductase [Terriglobales bacterium]|nr:SDR family oxidoreductase [Terriglobales bacterium]